MFSVMQAPYQVRHVSPVYYDPLGWRFGVGQGRGSRTIGASSQAGKQIPAPSAADRSFLKTMSTFAMASDHRVTQKLPQPDTTGEIPRSFKTPVKNAEKVGSDCYSFLYPYDAADRPSERYVNNVLKRLAVKRRKG